VVKRMASISGADPHGSVATPYAGGVLPLPPGAVSQPSSCKAIGPVTATLGTSLFGGQAHCSIPHEQGHLLLPLTPELPPGSFWGCSLALRYLLGV
jgi:hypothetical protein